MATEAEIIARGRRDYSFNREDYRNPFQPGSSEFNDYERGWVQALKSDDGRLVKVANTPYPVERPVSPPENLYAALKGRTGPLRKGPGST